MLSAGRVLSNLTRVSMCDGPEGYDTIRGSGLPAEHLQGIREMVSRVDPSITDDVRQKLENLLIKYKTAFLFGENDIGHTTLMKHRIFTGDAAPVRQRVRRQPPLHQAVIDKQIPVWLEQGVIEKAQRPWSANLVVVKW
jgi:hypothetical protein